MNFNYDKKIKDISSLLPDGKLRKREIKKVSTQVGWHIITRQCDHHLQPTVSLTFSSKNGFR